MGCAMRVSPLPITTQTRFPNFSSCVPPSHLKMKSLSSFTVTVKPIYTDPDDINGFSLSSPGYSRSVISVVRAARGVNFTISVEPDEPIDNILWRFRKAMRDSGLRAELMRRRFFENKQDIKKRKIWAAKKQILFRRMRRKSWEKRGETDKDDNEEEEEQDNWNWVDGDIGL